MNNLEFVKQCVCAGLKRCEKKPDMLICLCDQEYFGNKIGETPIMYSEYFEHPKNATISEEIFFIPVWYNSNNAKQTNAFYKGYDDGI